MEARRHGRHRQFTLGQVMIATLAISLLLALMRLGSTDREAAYRFLTVVMMVVGLGLMAALGYALVLGVDTLFFGRGSGARANRLRELEEKRRAGKKVDSKE